jgi:hypothetical protein
MRRALPLCQSHDPVDSTTQPSYECYSERLAPNASTTIRWALFLSFAGVAALLVYWPFERLHSGGFISYLHGIGMMALVVWALRKMGKDGKMEDRKDEKHVAG